MSKVHTVGELGCIENRKLDNINFYYVSNGSWFIKGERCQLETNCGPLGIFRGRHICIAGNGEVENCHYKVGDIRMDGEICGWEEFDIYDAKTNELLVKAEELNEEDD